MSTGPVQDQYRMYERGTNEERMMNEGQGELATRTIRRSTRFCTVFIHFGSGLDRL
jgi:hypothetical protein